MTDMRKQLQHARAQARLRGRLLANATTRCDWYLAEAKKLKEALAAERQMRESQADQLLLAVDALVAHGVRIGSALRAIQKERKR